MHLPKRQAEYQRFATKVLLGAGFNIAEAPDFSGKAGQLRWCIDGVAGHLMGIVIRVIKSVSGARMILDV
jgi:hypothetical protein